MTRPDRELQEWADRGAEQVRLTPRAAPPERPRDGMLAYADGVNWNPSGTGAGIYWYGAGSWYRLATGAGIPLVDGDKGDVVVSATGLTWTIDNDAVTFAKMQNVTSDKLLGRVSGGSGNVEEVGVESFAAATAVAETDYVLVSQSGAHKKATVDQLASAVFGDDWDDLRMPSQAIDPAGSTAPPSRSNTTGMLEFSGTVDNIISGVAQMPHSWKKESTIRPHLHVLFPTAAASEASRWKFEYNIGDPNEDFDNAYGTYTTLSTITIDNPNNAKRHVLGAFGDLDMTGRKESACILWRISRLASSDAADNHGSPVVLLEFDIHYQSDKTGTETEIPT